MELLAVLATPLVGCLWQALFGARRWAAAANVAISLVTFAAALALTLRVMGEGRLLAGREQFFVDPFNVFLVLLTAFVGWTTSMSPGEPKPAPLRQGVYISSRICFKVQKRAF